MRFAAQYLWDHRNIILLEILSAGIFAGVFYLYHLPLSAVLYPTALCAMLGLLFAAVSVRKAYAQHRRLEEMQYVSEEKHFSVLYSVGASDQDADLVHAPAAWHGGFRIGKASALGAAAD